jgi:hypothetical protein
MGYCHRDRIRAIVIMRDTGHVQIKLLFVKVNFNQKPNWRKDGPLDHDPADHCERPASTNTGLR